MCAVVFPQLFFDYIKYHVAILLYYVVSFDVLCCDFFVVYYKHILFVLGSIVEIKKKESVVCYYNSMMNDEIRRFPCVCHKTLLMFILEY